MIYGRLEDFEAMGLTALGPTARHAVDWIRKLPAAPAEGRYAFGDENGYALVLRYATGEAAESRFETHRQYVDLQYTLAGAETIDWAPRGSLVNDGDYDVATDLLFHHPGPVLGSLVKSAGYFSIHTPLDAHRPKIRVAGFAEVFKLVVKIPVHRFAA